jgi:hypothetical protein
MQANLSFIITEVYGFALDPRAMNTWIFEMQTVTSCVPGELGPLPIHHFARQLDMFIIEVRGHPVTSSGSMSHNFFANPFRGAPDIRSRSNGCLNRCLQPSQ